MMSTRFAIRSLFGLSLFGALVLIGGFFVFCATLPRAGALPDERWAAVPVSERGLVVLTGGGGQRIERGLELQDQGLAHRVLISGVHPQTSLQDLAAIGAPHVLACCVDLGPWARTTRGNAIEARDWLRKNDYRMAILVTSDFHLPRARAELQASIPEIDVIGIPVASSLAPELGWMSDPTSWRLLSVEYLKFLVVKARSVF